ncbi:unnamed protein product [Cylindrotheca closterium]|uniref:DNL-type domain-containing protein n=1 Tax=Cylindrotheca closterium TaxID=2856 RepID=A0AAD2GCC3_9STRA|nr:unnamed protein product [Cylindrotheca closterium]
MTLLRSMLAIALVSFLFVQANSFATLPSLTTKIQRKCLGYGCHQFPPLKQSSDDHEEIESKIPQLPAIGTSSLHQGGSSTVQAEPQGNSHEPLNDVAFVSPKFQLQYTCKVCNTRNHHLVSRIAYTEGVVITTCKGCKSKHMIADNLGSGCLDGDANIEAYFKARGMEDITRVTEEVFELEKVLNMDALVGDDGNPVLE